MWYKLITLCNMPSQLIRLYHTLMLTVVLAVFSSSCVRQEEQNINSRPIAIREAKGYIVPQDSMAEPVSIQIDERKRKTVTITKPSVVTPGRHSYTALTSEIIPLVPPQARIPGKEPYALPVTRQIGITPLQADKPEVVMAKEMRSKDQNPANFSIFSKLQGLRHNEITTCFEDHSGNLWIGTRDGFTRYDGKYFTHFTIRTGLANTYAHIFEDHAGNIWFDTGNTLVKFDGRTYARFGVNLGIGSFASVHVDRSGTIWIAPTTGGIDRLTPVRPASSGKQDSPMTNHADVLDPLQYTVSHFGQNEGFTDQPVHQILETKSGDHWFLLGLYGEMIKLEMTGLPQNRSEQPGGDASSDDTGNVSTYTFLHFKSPIINTFLIREDHLGNIWFNLKDGICKYDGFTLTRISIDNLAGQVLTFQMTDSDGNFWFSIPDKGALRYTPPSQGIMGSMTRFTAKDGLSDNTIYCILEDKSGNLWFGTADGLNRYNGKVLTHLTEKEGLGHSLVMSIQEDSSGNLWFGSFGYGASWYDGRTFRHYTKKDGLSGDYVWSILEDSNRDLWFGTLDGGMCKYTPAKAGQQETFAQFTDTNWPKGMVYDIHEDHSGNLWFGGVALNSRLYKYTPATENQSGILTSFNIDQGLSDVNILSIEEDKHDNIWFGTFQGGACRYTPSKAGQSGTFVQFTEKDGFIQNRVWSIVKDQKDNLWFCTNGSGLVFYDGKYFVNITEKEGLSDNHVLSSLLDRNGNLWFGTRFGLNMLPKHIVDIIAEKTAAGTLLESDILFHTYKYEDGFLGVGCTLNGIFEDSQGTIWVGTNDRVTAYHPKGDVRDTIAPNIQLIGIQLFNEDIDWSRLSGHRDSSILLQNGVKVKRVKFNGLSPWYGVPEHLSLAHDNNYITFNCIGITVNRPGSVKYQYRLDGLDINWNAPTPNNFATYGHLPPGRYSFKVKAMNSERHWSQEYVYPFIIRSPWWLTWWAYIIYVFMLAAAAYTSLHYFKRRLLLRQQLQMEKVESLRLKALDTFKSQLFTNLTHEFRTPLTVILGMAKQLAVGSWWSAVGEKERGIVAKSLKLIENNGRNLSHLINQLLDLSKLENKSFKLQSVQSDIVPYLRYVTESFQSYAEDLGLSLRFSSTADALIMDFDPEQMKQVLTNLISNALKFTPPGGEVSVVLTPSSGYLNIEVTDTGIGIASKDLPYVMDRFYQADSSTTRVAQGTGIGLAHAQELLKIMGGNIQIESEVGKGTQVYVQLPIRHDELVMENHEIARASISPDSVLGLHRKTEGDESSELDTKASYPDSTPQLLIIEDNPDVVDYLRSCLEDSYPVRVAYDGRAGAEKALENIPDLIISDVMMPEMDGYQICDLLKNDERTSHIPIILLTAKADAASRLAGLRRGADAYLAKPFDPDELLVQIAMLLENRRRMAAHFSSIFHQGIPQSPGNDATAEAIRIEDVFMKKVNGILEDNYQDEDFSLPRLCMEIGMSRSQLFRKMKAVADIAPSDLIRSYRLHKAKAMLEEGSKSVAEITYQVGFKDPSYFSKLFLEEFGVQPSALTK